jgi:hypothetical protein
MWNLSDRGVLGLVMNHNVAVAVGSGRFAEGRKLLNMGGDGGEIRIRVVRSPLAIVPPRLATFDGCRRTDETRPASPPTGLIEKGLAMA